jgi:hypothetical protein
MIVTEFEFIEKNPFGVVKVQVYFQDYLSDAEAYFKEKKFLSSYEIQREGEIEYEEPELYEFGGILFRKKQEEKGFVEANSWYLDASGLPRYSPFKMVEGKYILLESAR